MEAHDVIPEARDAISAKRVFGKAYSQNGVVVIPVAKVGGGGGGGSGTNGGGKNRGTGSGFGFGMLGQPVGAYVIRGNKVRWKPAIDVNTLLLRTQAIVAVAGFVALMRRRRR
jgi:uncharacterized spore protein YtfJ